jgi:hypothetical protein
MKPTFLITIGLTMIGLIACNATQKGVSQSMSTEDNTEKMIAEGYAAGVIELSNKEGDCPVTIRLEGGEETMYYDPLEIDDSYKVTGMKVWFKFSGLRMMNRCPKANPIRIENIKKREQ